jgi:hypothetical protein
MRLLNTSNLGLEVFYGTDIPKYVILSHRWENEEISLQELQERSNQHKAGWKKVREFCNLAQRYNYKYAWIDTCCIDKTSSAELQEALNSMFQWYRKADICCAYLNDASRSFLKQGNRYISHVELEHSEWFRRGWTLQELLAPRQLWFIGWDWKHVIGSREELADSISAITNIPKRYILEFVGSTVSHTTYHSGLPSIAEIMSWASQRVTTRIEDMAYSLMGLFGVQMPLLYGEGRNAFLRLQLEILKMSDDESIFAWHTKSSSELGFDSGLLAPSPACFTGCKYDVIPPSLVYDPERPPYAMTNKGLRIEPLLQKIKSSGYFELYLMPLHCFYLEDNASCAAIYLRRISRNEFRRVEPNKIFAHIMTRDKSNVERSLVYVRQDYSLG